MLTIENEFESHSNSKDKLSKSTIKIDNLEISEEILRKLIKEHPELLDIKKEGPLGNDFSMLEYIKDIYKIVSVARGLKTFYLNRSTIYLNRSTITRLRALIKIWEWKDKNDGAFGDKEVFNTNTTKWNVYYFCDTKKLHISLYQYTKNNTELPDFSSEEIAEKSLKELEAEYKIVFNVV